MFLKELRRTYSWWRNYKHLTTHIPQLILFLVFHNNDFLIAVVLLTLSLLIVEICRLITQHLIASHQSNKSPIKNLRKNLHKSTLEALIEILKYLIDRDLNREVLWRELQILILSAVIFLEKLPVEFWVYFFRIVLRVYKLFIYVIMFVCLLQFYNQTGLPSLLGVETRLVIAFAAASKWFTFLHLDDPAMFRDSPALKRAFRFTESTYLTFVCVVFFHLMEPLELDLLFKLFWRLIEVCLHWVLFTLLVGQLLRSLEEEESTVVYLENISALVLMVLLTLLFTYGFGVLINLFLLGGLSPETILIITSSLR